MNSMKQAMSLTIVMCLLVAGMSLRATAQELRTVTVTSQNYGYSYYRVDTGNRVRLIRQLSRTECEYDRTWGYDYRGVWVDGGCGAEFEVGGSNGGNGDGSHAGRNAAIAGAVVGGVVLAAILASRHKHDDKPGASETVPSWLVGTFRGYNSTYDTDVELTIYSSGTVFVRPGSGPEIRGAYSNGRLEINKLKFDVTQERNGFRTTQLGQPGNQVSYRRV